MAAASESERLAVCVRVCVCLCVCVCVRVRVSDVHIRIQWNKMLCNECNGMECKKPMVSTTRHVCVCIYIY